jgi:hypothetical protein
LKCRMLGEVWKTRPTPCPQNSLHQYNTSQQAISTSSAFLATLHIRLPATD